MIRETLVLMWHHCDDVYMILMRFVLMWLYYQFLTHCDRTTHGCDGYLTIIDSDNGFSPGRRQAIIWTDAGIFLIGPLGTNFGESLVEIHTFSFKQMHLKMSSRKWRQFFSRRQCVKGSMWSVYHTLQGCFTIPKFILYLINVCKHLLNAVWNQTKSYWKGRNRNSLTYIYGL